MPREGPVPAAWLTHGAPPEAMAAYAGGMCPRHRTPLAAGMFRAGGKGTGWYASYHWIPGGWCDDCRAWWSRPYGRMAELTGPGGLAAMWDTSGD